MQSEEKRCNNAMYPMRLVTRMTGLTADTIRVWERRYHAIHPQRTEGNTRMYSQQDVQRLQLLAQATKQGYRIGSIAEQTLSQLQQLVDEVDEKKVPPSKTQEPVEDTLLEHPQREQERLIQRYLGYIEHFNASQAERLLARASLLYSPRELIYKIFLPLLHEVGERWASSILNVSQEHLVSEQVKRRLLILLQSVTPAPEGPRMLFSTPPGQHHELGALIAAVLGSMAGFEPIYLGPNIPFEDLLFSIRSREADVLVLSLVLPEQDEDYIDLLRGLQRLAAEIEVWVGLPETLAKQLQNIPKMRLFSQFEEFERALKRWPSG